MVDQDVTRDIIHFAAQLAEGSRERCAISFARTRAWVDADGRATPDGRRLVDALADQRETRTAYRNLV
jgi:hypothetical protein